MAVPTTGKPAAAPKPKKQRKNPQRRKADKERAESLPSNLQASPASNPKTLAEAERSTSINPSPVITESRPSQIIKQSKAEEPTSKPRLIKSQTTPLQDFRALASTKPRTQVSPPRARPKRTQSDSLALAPPAFITGGLVGCAASSLILLSTHLWNTHAGSNSAILATKSAALCTSTLLSEVTTSLQHGTYSTEEALDILRRTTLAYAASIPGGASFVSKLFLEIDMLRKQRGREVDEVLREGYAELARTSARGASSGEVRDVLFRQLGRLSQFAGRGVQDVVDRNPGLRRWRDDAVKSLGGPPTSDLEKGRNAKVPTVKLNMAVRQKA